MNLPLSALIDFDVDLVKVAGITLAGVVIVSDMYFDHRKRELWHQTVRTALEKGQPIPESFALAYGGNPNRPRWRGYLLAGLINLSVGAGLFVSLSQIPDAPFNIGMFGFIPGFVGISLLIGAAIEASAARK